MFQLYSTLTQFFITTPSRTLVLLRLLLLLLCQLGGASLQSLLQTVSLLLSRTQCFRGGAETSSALRFTTCTPTSQLSFTLFRACTLSFLSQRFLTTIFINLLLPLHQEGMPALSFDVTIQGQLVHVSMFRLNPRSCRMCHFKMGHGGYQYPDADHAGPCGFSPPNPHLLTDWARHYQARYGDSPFKPAEKLAYR